MKRVLRWQQLNDHIGGFVYCTSAVRQQTSADHPDLSWVARLHETSNVLHTLCNELCAFVFQQHSPS